MLAGALLAMQHVLRAISGPHAGAVYVLDGRTTIGRASDCEIQILHGGVSRHHAKVTSEEDGTVTLADLSSDNGTFIDDVRVERHVLRPGEVVRIIRSRYIYERLEGEQTLTSVVFRRKVTSGDSLRQTVELHDSGSTLRAGVAQGLPAGLGDRGRPYSRPQAAAPALSGARPGAAASGGYSHLDTALGEDGLGVEVVVDPPSVRRPMPGASRPEDSAAFVRERWPQLGRTPTPPSESRGSAHASGVRAPSLLASRRPSQSVRSLGVPAHGESRPSEGLAGRPSTDPSLAADPASSGSYGWHAAARGSRELPIAMATTLPAVQSAAPSMSGPSGRMANPTTSSSTPGAMTGAMTPGAMTPGAMTPGAMTPGAMTPGATGPSSSGGWVRLPRPLDAPGSMRQGSTLSGLPWVGHDEDAGVSTTVVHQSEAAADASARKAVTAEYGALGGSPGHAHDTGSTEASVDGELDSMTTVPNVRRSVRPPRSFVPTEEVPRVDEPAPGEEDLYASIRSAATVVPGERAAEAFAELDAAELEAADLEAADAAAQSVEAADPDAPVARRRAGSSGYEDTLRFQRQETRTRAGAGAGVAAAAIEPAPRLTAAGEGHGGRERLVDILEYRELRVRALRGGADGRPAAERCEALERVLSQRPLDSDDIAAMRRYHRFAGPIQARLTQRSRGASSTAEVEVEDISAGGAKIVLAGASLAAGDTVWLSIALAQANRPHRLRPSAEIVVLKARVVWTRGQDAKVGLVFAGAPAYDVELSDESS